MKTRIVQELGIDVRCCTKRQVTSYTYDTFIPFNETLTLKITPQSLENARRKIKSVKIRLSHLNVRWKCGVRKVPITKIENITCDSFLLTFEKNAYGAYFCDCVFVTS